MRIGMNELCENCQYNGPYLSIINPCEHCPNNDFMINGTIPIVQPLRETTDHITNKTYATTTIDCQTITAKSNSANTGDVFATGLNADLPTADEYRNDIDKNKCPYCGTPYYDMSAVDFESGEPFYLKIRTNMNGQQVCITQLVKPILNTLTTNISFIGIPDQNGNLMTMTVE